MKAKKLVLQEHTPDIILTHKIDVDFVYPTTIPNNEKNIAFVNKFFHSITKGDRKLITLLYELIGLCCYRSARFEIAYIFKANGANGKSKYFDVIQALAGNSCSNLCLKDIVKRDFSLHNLYNMTVNISDDEEQLKDIDTGVLKRTISGNQISADKKYEVSMLKFKPFATLLISLNNNINFKDSSYGFTRKFRVIPFNNIFKGAERDINLEDKLLSPTVLQIIAFRAMNCFRKVLLENRELTEPVSVTKATEDYFAQNNPLKYFVSKHSIDDMVSHKVQKELYHKQYIEFCKSKGFRYINDIGQFCKELYSLGIGIEAKDITIPYNKEVIHYLISGSRYIAEEDIDLKFHKYSYNQLCAMNKVTGWDWYEQGWYDGIKSIAPFTFIDNNGNDIEIEDVIIQEIIDNSNTNDNNINFDI